MNLEIGDLVEFEPNYGMIHNERFGIFLGTRKLGINHKKEFKILSQNSLKEIFVLKHTFKKVK